ncbi:hypothetical protein KJ671_04100 [Patescibacteria group bacterium]|nr:hypothetical protein [Patescibacteria group bacterium]
MIELLIVLGITVVMGSIMTTNYFGYQTKQSLNGTSDELLGSLRNTQQSAITQDGESAWGIYVNAVTDEKDYYEIFYGDSYAAGTVVSTTTLPTDVQFSAPAQGSTAEIVFAKSTGIPSGESYFSIVSTRNSSFASTITFNTTSGLIDFIPNFSCEEVVSYDDKSYDTVIIGSQCWMAENLDYDDGCSLITWVDATDVGWCGYYTGGPFANEGLLYQWSAAMDGSTTAGAQGLCPTGWHIPTDAEWCTLEQSVDSSITCDEIDSWRGIDGGGKLKETGYTHWNSPNTGATNSSGFTALGVGFRGYYGDFGGRLGLAYFWSSVESGGNGVGRNLASTEARIGRGEVFPKVDGFSVRCVKN